MQVYENKEVKGRGSCVVRKLLDTTRVVNVREKPGRLHVYPPSQCRIYVRTKTDSTSEPKQPLHPIPHQGAYILSPLEEGSRDPIQNAGFSIHWLNKNQTTRVTSYSVRNSVDVIESPNSSRPSSPLLSLSKSTSGDPLVAPKPVPTPAMNPLLAFANAFKVNPTPVQTPAVDATATSPSALDPPSTPKAATTTTTTTTTTKPSIPGLSRPSTSRRPTALSRILSSAAPPPDSGETSFAAFKMLPIDPARSWRGSRFAEPADELTGAANCREAVDVVTEAIRKACEDVGAVGEGFVKEEDVVRFVLSLFLILACRD